MERDVLVTISGLQRMGAPEDEEPIKVIAPGQYYFKNGKHYVLYDEVQEIYEGETNVTRNTLQFKDRYLSVTKHGAENVHMVIESEKKNVTYYHTPIGMLHISLDGKRVNVSDTEESISVDARYGLDINYEHVANCHLKIDVRPKDEGIDLAN